MLVFHMELITGSFPLLPSKIPFSDAWFVRLFHPFSLTTVTSLFLYPHHFLYPQDSPSDAWFVCLFHPFNLTSEITLMVVSEFALFTQSTLSLHSLKARAFLLMETLSSSLFEVFSAFLFFLPFLFHALFPP